MLVQGSNGGYQGINLLWIWGAETILLLGYDMQHTGGKTHWHGDHQGKLSNFPSPANIIQQYQNMHPEKYGLTVINCSRQTALPTFPRMALEEALEKLSRHSDQQRLQAS